MTGQLATLGIKDEKELQNKVEKLQELFKVLTKGESEELNIPQTLSKVNEFDANTQAFISTLLVALAQWISPQTTISEADFITRLVKQMALVQRERRAKREEEFLDRVRTKMEEKEAKGLANLVAFNRMESEGCTFKPMKRIPCPDTRTPVPVTPPRVRSDKLPTVFDRSPVVSRLAVQSPAANRTDVTPAECTGQRLQYSVNAIWETSLRREEREPLRTVSNLSSPNDDDSDVTETGRRKHVYGRHQPCRTTGTHGYVERPKSWVEDLRGGFVSSHFDTSPADFGCRMRLHEARTKSFTAYRPPASQYKPPDLDFLRQAMPVPGIGLSMPEPVERGTVLAAPGSVNDVATMETRQPEWVSAGKELKNNISWAEASHRPNPVYM